MNAISKYSLKALRKIYSKIVNANKIKQECEQDSDMASKLIFDALNNDEPCMIARFGSTELNCLGNYLSVNNNKGKYIDYIKGNTQSWWWEKNAIKQMQDWSGFFTS